MKRFRVLLCILSLFLISALSDRSYSADDAPTNYKSRMSGERSGMDSPFAKQNLEDLRNPNDPDSLWYHYKNTRADHDAEYPKVVMKGTPVISKDYNPEAFLHLKNMAIYCNQKWQGQKCLRRMSLVGVDLTKDYMKKIYRSKDIANDHKPDLQNFLREGCSGIVIKQHEEIIPIVMRDKLRECLVKIKQVSDTTKEHPDENLRQLVMGATYCIVRERQCNFIEGQLDNIAPPKKKKEVEEEAAPEKE